MQHKVNVCVRVHGYTQVHCSNERNCIDVVDNKADKFCLVLVDAPPHVALAFLHFAEHPKSCETEAEKARVAFVPSVAF